MADQEQALNIFQEDTHALGNYVSTYVTQFYPAYAVDPSPSSIQQIKMEDSLSILNSFTFYRIVECSIYNVEDRLDFFSKKMQRLFTAAYAMKQQVCYGVVSEHGRVSLLLGIAPSSDNDAMKSIVEGLLPGITLEKRVKGQFQNNYTTDDKGTKREYPRTVGCISGVPALKVDGKLRDKDLSSLIRSLNGHDYTVMIMCRPVSNEQIQGMIDSAIEIQDGCFAISKRTLSNQTGKTEGNTHQDQYGEADNSAVAKQKGVTVNAGLAGAAGAAAVGAAIGSVVPGIGTVVGAIGGGVVGLIVGKQISFSKSTTTTDSKTISKGYSDAVSQSITQSKSISGEVQNGYAIELMNMAAAEVERLKKGRSIGMWQSVVSYSSDDPLAAAIIKGSLYSEIASEIPDILPPVVFEYIDSNNTNNESDSSKHNQQLIVPKGFFEGSAEYSVQSFVTSEELCGICTIPTDEVFGFEVKERKGYAINRHCEPNDIQLGTICEYDREIKNAPFGLSKNDLNKHTFVCGITGCGKTNTVKTIISKASDDSIPFLVIEPAKKEYRNMAPKPTVYTLGRPEAKCLQFNPFYIQPGVSPQHHIDLLKDLFSASFGFYGPMPFIMEKCLNRVYIKKGWNLTLGFHPAIVGDSTTTTLFSLSTLKGGYSRKSCRYLFPTMQDLKDEVDHYVEEELSYEGEVKGNIRGAINARLDSLCIGAKGYMFNTSTPINMEEILHQNTVFELEGLSDDGDKAFALGLIIILINEFRETNKEVEETHDLKHLLVIEEAHRLLSNVPMDVGGDIANPKEKAVAHFTNILAEMRSYGQGVIVAEQIPSKLAPDVIKNSSNKIVHRLVAKDDQEVIANTVGVNTEDSIYLGSFKTGYALCHKEGMTQPVIVKLSKYTTDSVLPDDALYNNEISTKLDAINQSIIMSTLPKEVFGHAVKFLVSVIMGCNKKTIYNGIEHTCNLLKHKAKLAGAVFTPGVEINECIKHCIEEATLSILVCGGFRVNKPVEDETEMMISKILSTPDDESLCDFNKTMVELYECDPKDLISRRIAALFCNEYVCGHDIEKYIPDFVYTDEIGLSERVMSILNAQGGNKNAAFC